MHAFLRTFVHACHWSPTLLLAALIVFVILIFVEHYERKQYINKGKGDKPLQLDTREKLEVRSHDEYLHQDGLYRVNTFLAISLKIARRK